MKMTILKQPLELPITSYFTIEFAHFFLYQYNLILKGKNLHVSEDDNAKLLLFPLYSKEK